VLPDRHHPDAYELRGLGGHNQLNIRTGVFGVHVSRSYSCHYFPGERLDWRQGWWRKLVEDGPNRVEPHQ